MGMFIDALAATAGPLGVVLGVAGTAVVSRRAKIDLSRKTVAEADKILAETVQLLLTPLQAEIVQLRERILVLESENYQLRTYIRTKIFNEEGMQ